MTEHQIASDAPKSPRGPSKNDWRIVTGYDLVEFLRQWLQNEGYGGMSVCEVILTQERFRGLRCYVAKATIFWSHIQLESFLGESGTLGSLWHYSQSSKSLPQGQRFFWLDYFCLRQCKNDFHVEVVVSLVKEIGCLVADVDLKMNNKNAESLGYLKLQDSCNYLQRSFCMLELYAAVEGKADLVCNSGWDKEGLEAMLAEKRPPSGPKQEYYAEGWLGSLHCQAANARDAKDKKQIDDFISGSVGFDEMNESITAAILKSAHSE